MWTPFSWRSTPTLSLRGVYPNSTFLKYTDRLPLAQWQTVASMQNLESSITPLPRARAALSFFVQRVAAGRAPTSAQTQGCIGSKCGCCYRGEVDQEAEQTRIKN